MNRQPDLIAPVIIVACAMIVIGGIGLGLSQAGDSATTATSPVASQPDKAIIPATGTPPGAIGTGAGGAPEITPPGTLLVANTTAPSYAPTDAGPGDGRAHAVTSTANTQPGG
jgi:hypothetical protein